MSTILAVGDIPGREQYVTAFDVSTCIGASQAEPLCTRPMQIDRVPASDLEATAAELAAGFPAVFRGARVEIADGRAWTARSVYPLDTGKIVDTPWAIPMLQVLPMPVPEPGLIALLAGCALLAAWRRR